MTWWVAGAAVVGGIGGALISSNSVDNAAASQAAGTQAAIDEQHRQFDLTRSDFAPYHDEGVNALHQLSGEINQPITAAEVMADPGYQFGLDQGQKQLNQKIAASGGRISGQALKAAAQYGTNYATTGYGAAYQRRQDRLNRLAALAGIGQTATNSSAIAGQNSANNISGYLSNQGDNAGAAQVARGNIWAGTANQLAAIYGRSRGYGGGGSNYGAGVYSGSPGQSWGTSPYEDPFYMGP